jgi:hypothetical protein
MVRDEKGQSRMRSLLTAVLSLLVGAGLATARDTAGWPFSVTPGCTPNFSVTLVDLESETLPALRLVHELSFDGAQYFSRLLIPQISSFLVRDEYGFLWASPSGLRFRFPADLGPSVGRFAVRRAAPFSHWQYEVLDDRDRVSYRYMACRLVEISGETVKYALDIEPDGRLTGIRQTAPVKRTLLTVTHAADGSLTIATGHTHFQVLLDSERGIRGVVFQPPDYRKVEVSFSDGLLASISCPTGSRMFRWGMLRDRNHLRPDRPIRPVVVDDGEFTYAASQLRHLITVRFRGTAQERLGSWTWDASMPGQVQVRERRPIVGGMLSRLFDGWGP